MEKQPLQPYVAPILLVEDETDILVEANREYLEARGHNVLTATTCAAALTLLWEHTPKLLLLDVRLPDGNGYDFCKLVRKMTTAPVIFLTAMDDEMDIVRGLNAGGDDYIVKPYSMQVMGNRVDAALRRSGNFETRLHIPPLFIDLASGQVLMHNEEISLSPKELQMLVFLARHLGQEFSQQRLYKEIWGGEPSTMGSTVRATVSRLRQKMHLDDHSYFALNSAPNNGYVLIRTRYPAGSIISQDMTKKKP